jgi:hypothetical protein
MTIADLNSAIFRASPDLELVLLDRLEPSVRAQVDVKSDSGVYGVLRARATGRPLHVVDQDVALLFYTLQIPGSIPEYARSAMSDFNDVVELVLDGVLEVESAKGFVHGPRALPAFTSHRVTSVVTTRLGRLSAEALQYGAAIADAGTAQVAARLYCFNSEPHSAYWARRLPSASHVERYLGIEKGNTPWSRLDDHWRRADQLSSAGWKMWQAIDQQSPSVEPYFKLYVSPTADGAPEVLGTTVALLDHEKCLAFKIGEGLRGLLRPDLFIAYFVSMDDLRSTATKLASELAGCPAKGVPFTASLCGDGLLSWARDPLSDQFARPKTSWRAWLVSRLAGYLVLASSTKIDGLEPYDFALQRLAFAGVDISSWSPRTEWTGV